MIVIKRCPTCQTIRSHTREVAAALRNNLDLLVAVTDGSDGEFAVLVDGVIVIEREGDQLPWPEEVDSAVRFAELQNA
jgi:predicted Rdx family selenoprotein